MSGLVARVIGSLLLSSGGAPLSLLPTTTVRVSILSDQSHRWLHTFEIKYTARRDNAEQMDETDGRSPESGSWIFLLE